MDGAHSFQFQLGNSIQVGTPHSLQSHSSLSQLAHNILVCTLSERLLRSKSPWGIRTENQGRNQLGRDSHRGKLRKLRNPNR